MDIRARGGQRQAHPPPHPRGQLRLEASLRGGAGRGCPARPFLFAFLVFAIANSLSANPGLDLAEEPPAPSRGSVLGLAPPGPPLEEPASLSARSPRRISSSIGSAGQGWIGLSGDFEYLSEAPFEAVWSLLRDYLSYPEVFGRIDRVEARRLSAESVELRQRTVIRVLGIESASEYLLRIEEELLAGGRSARIGFLSLADDGSLSDIRGGWYLEARREGCYIRYALSSRSRELYPLQREIMSMFMDADFQKLLKELERGALRAAR